MNSNCSNLLDMRNLQEQVKKAFCYQKMFWPFTAWTNCSRDFKIFANSRPSALNFKYFSRSLEQFLLTVGLNNFGNKKPILSAVKLGNKEQFDKCRFKCKHLRCMNPGQGTCTGHGKLQVSCYQALVGITAHVWELEYIR